MTCSPSIDLLLLLQVNPRGSLHDLTVGLSSGLVVGGSAIEGCPAPLASPPPVHPVCAGLDDREAPFQLLCTYDVGLTGDVR